MICKLKLFKKIIFLVLVMAVAGLGTSCSEFLKGKPKNQKVISYKNNKLACLDNISGSYENFLQTRATMSEVDQTFDCLDKTFVELQQRAEGAEGSDYFTAYDIHNIFEDFVPSAKINNETSLGILRLKSALIGGDKDKLTKVEIDGVRSYLKVLKVEVKKMLPYASLLNVKLRKRVLSQNDITIGYKQLTDSLKVLLAESRVFQSDYGFDELKQLIIDMGLVTSEQKGMVNLLGEIKNLFVGQTKLTTEEDYNSLIDSFMGIFKIYSLSQQNYIGFNLVDGATLDNTINSAFDLIDILENCLQFKKTQMISADSVDAVVGVLLQKNLVSFTDGNPDKNLLNLPITADTMKAFYKVIFAKVFDAGRAGDRKNFYGITKLHFDNLKRELGLYQVYATFLDSLGQKTNSSDDQNAGLSLEEIRSQLKKFDPRTVKLVYGRFDKKTQDDITVGFNEMSSEFFFDRPVLYKNKRMIIVADQNKLNQNWEDLSYSLFNKLLARILVLGWSDRSNHNNEVMKMKLTSDGLVDWYSDFRDIGIELKMFDPRQKNTGAKSFLEANLFTYSGDGNDTMSFYESIQYLNMITSGGGRTVDALQEGLSKAGCNLENEEKDAFGYYWKSEECFSIELRKNFKSYFSYLPYMVGYVDRMNDQEFKFFYDELMSVARTTASNKGTKIEYSDLRNVSMLLSYIESLFAVADLNHNWAVTDKEIRGIYPRFKSFATDYAYAVSKDKIDMFKKWNQCSNYNVDDLIRESFIYLVYNGKTPEMNDINYISCLFGNDLISFKGEVNRTRIISTFKILKDVIDSKSK